jgi:hypothetical protein
MEVTDYKCDCGETIIFEVKRTFLHPNTRNGFCPKCKTQYKLVGDKLIKKEK